MDRPLISQIYAYAVCFLAIVVGLASLAGVVNNIFRAAHPTEPRPRNIMFRQFGGPLGPPDVFYRVQDGNVRYRVRPEVRGGGPIGGGPVAIPKNAMPPNMNALPGPPQQVIQMRSQALGDARYDAIRALIVRFVLLIAAILLFNWHWRWLHGTRVVYSQAP